ADGEGRQRDRPPLPHGAVEDRGGSPAPLRGDRALDRRVLDHLADILSGAGDRVAAAEDGLAGAASDRGAHLRAPGFGLTGHRANVDVEDAGRACLAGEALQAALASRPLGTGFAPRTSRPLRTVLARGALLALGTLKPHGAVFARETILARKAHLPLDTD